MSTSLTPETAGQLAGSETVIRPATLDDLAALQPILEVWLRDRNTDELLPQEVHDTLDAVRTTAEGRTDRTYLVAELGGQVVGMMGFKKPDRVMQTFARRKPTVEFINAYVDPNIRRKGIGQLLLLGLEETARQQGYAEVIVNSGPRYQHKGGWDFWTRHYGQPAYIAREYYGRGGDAPVWRHLL